MKNNKQKLVILSGYTIDGITIDQLGFDFTYMMYSEAHGKEIPVAPTTPFGAVKGRHNKALINW